MRLPPLQRTAADQGLVEKPVRYTALLVDNCGNWLKRARKEACRRNGFGPPAETISAWTRLPLAERQERETVRLTSGRLAPGKAPGGSRFERVADWRASPNTATRGGLSGQNRRRRWRQYETASGNPQGT